jgi:hypothetical protein
MKLAPVKNYSQPKFPTREILNRHPELLRVLPRRWRTSPVVLGTLAGLLSLLEQSTAKASDGPDFHVAPIFEHGVGSGAFGGIGMSPVIFLTEAEARNVIEEEARNAGVELTGSGHTLSGVELPITDRFAFLDKMDENRGKKPSKPKKTSQTGELELSGWSEKLHVGYKFVSRKDFDSWQTKDSTRACTVSQFDIKDAANRLQKGLVKVTEPATVAVFYDPCARPAKRVPIPKLPADKSKQPSSAAEKQAAKEANQKSGADYWKNYEMAAKKVGEEELRSQVRDFIAWLKAQGII